MGLRKLCLALILRHLVGGQPDEAPAGLHHRGEARPADAAAPQRRDPAVGHHQRAVAGLFQIVRLKILLAVEAEPVGDVAAEQGQPRRPRAPGDRLADQIAQALRRAVAAHREHAGIGIDRLDDQRRGLRLADRRRTPRRPARRRQARCRLCPRSSRPMFSALPLVFWVSTLSDLSVSLMTAAALSPKNGNPPPGVAVASVTRVGSAITPPPAPARGRR